MNQSALIGVVGLIVGALLAAVYYSTRPVDTSQPAAIPCAIAKNYCVNVQVLPVAGTPTITVSSQDVYVNGPDVTIWLILQNAPTQNYTFAANGIVFGGKPPPAVDPPLNEFNCRSINAGMVYRCDDKNATRGAFGYTITLGGTGTLTLDPWIHNN